MGLYGCASGGGHSVGFKNNRARYQGNEYITENGLNWMDFNFRQYDPQTGGFLSVDPLAAAGGQESWSSYAAMGNNPGMAVDPDGLIAQGVNFPSTFQGRLDINPMGFSDRATGLNTRNPYDYAEYFRMSVQMTEYENFINHINEIIKDNNRRKKRE